MPQLAQVNTNDIGGAIRLGCRPMGRVFNADDGDIPFFTSRVWPEPELSFSAYHSETHVPGRRLHTPSALIRYRRSERARQLLAASLAAIALSGLEAPAQVSKGYLFFENPPVGAPLTIALPLPESELVLQQRTHHIRVRLRGDQAVAMDNFGADWTFFDPID